MRVGRGLDGLALQGGLRLIGELNLIRIDDDLLNAAGSLDPPPLRSLDAIHVASAESLGEALGALITYDERMLQAARGVDLPTLAPR